MQSKGLRIKDKLNNVVVVEISDILNEIPDPNQYVWSILYLEGEGSPKNISYRDLVDQISISKEGYILSWEELNEYVYAIYSIYWIQFIGCKNVNNVRKYKIEREMYESTDICIELFDSSYWEIFTNDPTFYNNLINKFKIEKYLDTDFLEKQ